jgi:hypothetical protein
MKFQLVNVIILFVVGALLCGCGGVPSLYNTPGSVAQAKLLASQVSDYQQAQSARVAKLTANFNSNFNQLMKSLDTISAQQLLQDRDEEAQTLSDTFISDSSASLRQAFRDAFLTAQKSDLTAISSSDSAVAAARTNYQQTYKAISIPLAQLKTAQQDLQALSENGSDTSQVVSVLQELYSAYQSASAKQSTTK